MKLTTYLSLCSEYYELDKPTAPKDALAFYSRYIEAINGAILEPMCGTGRFLLPILQEGYDIEGYDASPTMLAILQQKAERIGLKPRIWEQFVEGKPKSDKCYDLILIPSGSFGLITDEDKIRMVLTTFYHQLNKQGKLVFEAETPAASQFSSNTWQGNIRYRSANSYILLNTLNLPPLNNINTSICKYELIESDIVIKTEVEKFEYKMHVPKILIKQLMDNGFSEIKLHKAYQNNVVPTEQDEVIIYECSKL